MTPPRRPDRPGLLLWLNTTVKSRACLIAERCGSRREDRQARGHAARGGDQQPAPGEVSTADVEPAVWSSMTLADAILDRGFLVPRAEGGSGAPRPQEHHADRAV